MIWPCLNTDIGRVEKVRHAHAIGIHDLTSIGFRLRGNHERGLLRKSDQSII